MAILKAPFLSLGASGKLAKTLVAFTWKGLKVVREYVVPANPQTADQTVQRDAMTDSVAAYRNYFTAPTGRAAWNNAATASGDPQSGFNVAIHNMLGRIKADPAASFADAIAAVALEKAEFTMKNLDDGAAGDEAGNFEIWAGDSATSLLLQAATKAIAAGKITTDDLGTAGDVKYAKIRKDGFDRSGIAKLTLIA
jgi:hypothetical protein